jgi:hypothetical protein
VLWYGDYNKTYVNIISRNQNKINRKSLQLSQSLSNQVQINKQTFRLYKPDNWSLVITSPKGSYDKVVTMYSPAYILRLPIPSGLVDTRYDTNTNTLSIHNLYLNHNYRLFWGFMQQCFRACYAPSFKKVKFKGKGYYIYKNKRNTITPQFGYAHRLYLYSYFVSVKFLSKTSIIIFGFSKTDLVSVSLGIKSMRPINIFTGRGVRFSRQIIYKKVGKVSSYR